MTAADLVRHARAIGVQFRPERGRLRYRAPAGVVPPELRDALATNKATVLRVLAAEAAGWTGDDAREFLAERAAIRQHMGGFRETTAARLAWNDLDRALGLLADDIDTAEPAGLAALFDAVPVHGPSRDLTPAEEADAIAVYALRSDQRAMRDAA